MSRKPGQPLELAVKQRIAELVGAGLTYVETAGALSISEATVNRVLRDPQYRKIAEDLKSRRESLSAAAANTVRDLLEAVNPDGTPNLVQRAKGAELYARTPALLDAAEHFEDEELLPGCYARIIVFPHPNIPDPDAPVTFSESDLAPIPHEPQ